MNTDVKKIEIVVPKDNVFSLLEAFQGKGFLEVIEKSQKEEETSSKAEYKMKMSEINFALSFLQNFEPKENFFKNLIFSFVPQKEAVKKDDLDKIINSREIGGVISKCSQKEEKINQLKSRKDELLGELSVLERFESTSLYKDRSIRNFFYYAGVINKKEKENFLNDLSKKKYFFIEDGLVDNFSYNFAVYYHKDQENYFLETVKKYEVKEESVFWNEEPKKALEIRKKELGEVDLELEIQEKEVQKLLFYLPQIKVLSDWYNWQIQKEDFLQETEKTKKYISIIAWVAKDDIKQVKEIVKEETPYFLIKEVPLIEGEKPPVILRNRGVVGSFGIVTGVYGLPKSDEIDPTPYLAPFFIFYFALALSDAGYGLLLAVLSFLAKKFFKKANADKFFNLFIFCGILTVIIGAFIGTVFGENLLQGVRITDPMSDPIAALMFVLALGVLQIFVGLIIGMIWLIKKGKLKEAVAGNGSSIIFFIGVILFIITKNVNFIISGAISMAILSFVYAEGSGVFTKLGKVFGSLYGLIGFVGDILSYSRILALGLATGIIAAVINMIAVIFKDMIPVPGLDLLVAGIVLVVGHIGNLLINTLGAFIHSARLQFVEFFSKFMEGGGRYFKPLEKNGRFIKIIN